MQKGKVGKKAKKGVFCLGIILEALVIVETPKSNSNFEEYCAFISVAIARMFLLQKETYKVLLLMKLTSNELNNQGIKNIILLSYCPESIFYKP